VVDLKLTIVFKDLKLQLRGVECLELLDVIRVDLDDKVLAFKLIWELNGGYAV